MRPEDRETYRRGARVVVPAVLLATGYLVFRVWLIMRPPHVDITLDEDAMAQALQPVLQRMVDVCEDAGRDSPGCERWLADALHDGGD